MASARRGRRSRALVVSSILVLLAGLLVHPGAGRCGESGRASVPPARAAAGNLPVTLPLSKFDGILRQGTATAELYEGVPLATLPGTARGRILKECMRCLDQERHQAATFSPGGSRRGEDADQPGTYDWLRDGRRVVCRSSQLQLTLGWAFVFRHIRPPFDELHIALYTPSGIHVYRHDGQLGATTRGVLTEVQGYDIVIRAAPGLECREALADILARLDSPSNACCRIGFMALDDPRLADWSAKYIDSPTLLAYSNCPLAHSSPAVRGDRLQAIARACDERRHPPSRTDVTGSSNSMGRRGWVRDGARVDCKSAQFVWASGAKRWQFMFGDIKFGSFDVLHLVLYTPRAVYIYEHDLQLGVTTQGERTAVSGHHILLKGPAEERDWLASLQAVLGSLAASSNSCRLLAVLTYD